MIGAIWVGPASVAGLATIAALLACGALWGKIGTNDRADSQYACNGSGDDLGEQHALDVMDGTLSHQR